MISDIVIKNRVTRLYSLPLMIQFFSDNHCNWNLEGEHGSVIIKIKSIIKIEIRMIHNEF
jgi:hypothetical protein